MVKVFENNRLSTFNTSNALHPYCDITGKAVQGNVMNVEWSHYLIVNNLQPLMIVGGCYVFSREQKVGRGLPFPLDHKTFYSWNIF